MGDDRIWGQTGGMNRRLRVVASEAAPHVDDRRKLTLRLPEELGAWLEQQARSNDRSLNAEIVSRLRRSRDSYRQ